MRRSLDRSAFVEWGWHCKVSGETHMDCADTLEEAKRAAEDYAATRWFDGRQYIYACASTPVGDDAQYHEGPLWKKWPGGEWEMEK